MSRLMIPNGGEGTVAEYKTQVIEEYKDNPFIEALPPIYSKLEVVDKLVSYPKYNKCERNLDSHYKIHLVQRLFQCFQPLEVHLDLESRISRVIRQGYLARNPFNPDFISEFKNGRNMVNNLNGDLCSNSNFRTTAAGFSIVGVSGMGKTTAINKILSTIPQIIVHSRYKDLNFSMYQLVWLKIDCPYDGSLRGLCMEFFSKVDNLLGTNYYIKHINGRHTVDSMLSVMSQVSRNIGLGVIVLDEIQHLKQSVSGGSEKMLNFFVTLVNTIGLPTILIGTTKALSVLQSEFRQARRGSGQGDMIWDRLQKDASWNLLIEALWDYQWTKKETPLTPEINQIMYDESQGIIDIAVKLYAMTQIRAILSGVEEVSINLIKQVAEENLRLVRPMIEALKSGDIRRIAQYEDICSIDFKEFLNLEKPRFTSEDVLKQVQLSRKHEMEKENNASNKEKAVLKLSELDIEIDKATEIVEKIITDKGEHIEVSEIVISAIQLISDKKDVVSRVRKAKVEYKDTDDLRFIAAEGREKRISVYEIFKDKEIIKNHNNDLFGNGRSVC